MATAAAPQHTSVPGTRFFTIMAFVMSAIILAGFSLNLAMGRSTFAVPWQFHVHGLIFMSWIGLYLAQHVTINSGNIALHVRLGKLAYLWIPLMVAAGVTIIVTSARRNGGPFFFDMNEFFVSNLSLLLCFGGLAFWALKQRRYTGWHRRLMLCAMAILTGPGLGRLLPLPLMIPYSWTVTFLVTLIFPIIGMIADKRRDGVVHPAYKWGFGIYVGTFIASMLLAYSPIGYAVTEWLVAGTPGAERPMQAFLPPGFSM
ncbi:MULTISPECIES: hypothetical protein [Qipengyuania]|uniref:DUF2306 domain-containing protein n=1 Tax=Qipengyuania soli TaxID=2782568 RepID=A0A7S8F4U2_9SPHN|nr:hypothetical protein [Qipengyuania soli]QPC99239.1 hypothetical protein IRL76_01250 [Qipengyuania soli]